MNSRIEHCFCILNLRLAADRRLIKTMNRKTFLVLSGMGLLAVSGTLYLGIRGYKNRKNVLSRPESLALFCEDDALVSMGKQYLELYPQEQDLSHLISLINSSQYSQEQKLRKQLQDNIRRDFEFNQTMILDGWVISRTEARQCALFTLMQQE